MAALTPELTSGVKLEAAMAIVAELRRDANKAYMCLPTLSYMLNSYATRLEAVLGGLEGGDMAKMRKALGEAADALEDCLRAFGPMLGEAKETAFRQCLSEAWEAQEAPARNCDVGTAKEQDERYRSYCSSKGCRNCPCDDSGCADCSFAWAQLPYETTAVQEGGEA